MGAPDVLDIRIQIKSISLHKEFMIVEVLGSNISSLNFKDPWPLAFLQPGQHMYMWMLWFLSLGISRPLGMKEIWRVRSKVLPMWHLCQSKGAEGFRRQQGFVWMYVFFSVVIPKKLGRMNLHVCDRICLTVDWSEDLIRQHKVILSSNTVMWCAFLQVSYRLSELRRYLSKNKHEMWLKFTLLTEMRQAAEEISPQATWKSLMNICAFKTSRIPWKAPVTEWYKNIELSLFWGEWLLQDYNEKLKTLFRK